MLNHILHEQRHRKVAVIENEFGEVPIDNEILGQNKHASAEQVVVLGNGCMCCQVRGDILGAFAQIGATVTQGNHLDSVVVETTGLADPLPIVRTFLQTPAIANQFRLDGVITMIDAKHLLERLGDTQNGAASGGKVNEAFQQIMFANKIVLNKLDLVSSDVVREVWARVRSINTTARIQGAVRGQLDPDDLTGLLAFDMTNVDMDAEIQAEQDHEVRTINE
jgi:G3E family GTPase